MVPLLFNYRNQECSHANRWSSILPLNIYINNFFQQFFNQSPIKNLGTLSLSFSQTQSHKNGISNCYSHGDFHYYDLESRCNSVLEAICSEKALSKARSDGATMLLVSSWFSSWFENNDEGCKKNDYG